MIISIFVSIFGLIVGYRTAAMMNSYKIFQIDPRFVLFFTLFSQFFLNFWISNHVFLLSIDLILFFMPILLVFIIQQRRKSYFKVESVLILDQMIAQMTSGKSLRESLSVVIANLSNNNFVQFHFSELLRAILFQKETKTTLNDSFLSEFHAEISQIDKSNLKTIDRLRAFRNKLKIELEFCRKSSQATLQVRAQTLILSLMYVLLLVYVVIEFGFKDNQSLILLSNVLFLFGLIAVAMIGRRFKWKA